MNNKKYSKVVVLFILAIGLNIQEIQAVEQVDLKLMLRPNQKFEMRMTTKLNASQPSQRQGNKPVHEEIIDVVFHVQDVNSQGDILMKVTFAKLLVKSTSSKSTMVFDSTKPDADPKNRLAPTYSALIGQSLKIKFSSNGNILELQSIDDMLLKMAEKVIAAEDKKMNKKTKRKINQQYGTRKKRREKMKKMIEVFFGEWKIRAMMRAFIPILPSGPVKPGDSWECGIEFADLRGPEINLKNTLKNYENDKVVIDSAYKKNIDDKPIKNKNNPNMKFTKIDYKGTAQIDKSNGWIIHKEVKTSLSVEVVPQGIKQDVNIIKIIEPVESVTHP
ncbi:MAG: DUF6263 family protein [Planctomycetota bacterium]